MSPMLASIIIRTFNEERHLGDLLEAIGRQRGEDLAWEVILVDSGSTDGTVAIAEALGARVVHIDKSEFSFGRSLNLGCSVAQGDAIVFVSGHCVPADDRWLAQLVEPLRSSHIAMTYGRQIGGHQSKFSELQLFDKFYPTLSCIPQSGFFVNNANSALARSVWEAFHFDEELTGLEDMHLGRRLVGAGRQIGYVAEAAVYHYHHETWSAVRRRYEREAIALQHILPEIHITLVDFGRYFTQAIVHDMAAASSIHRALGLLPEIVMFRLMQFWGTYRGNHRHRQLSRSQKERYFYPKGTTGEVVALASRSSGGALGSNSTSSSSSHAVSSDNRAAPHEGEQRAREGEELPRFRG